MTKKEKDALNGILERINTLTAVFVEEQTETETLVMVQISNLIDEVKRLQVDDTQDIDTRCISLFRRVFTRHFNMSETHEVLADMGISEFEGWTGNLSSLHTAITGHCDRRGTMAELAKVLSTHRPRFTFTPC